MKQKILRDTNEQSGHIALHMMISRVSTSFLQAATRKNSFIVNDVPADLKVNADENMVATVFGSLLNTIIACGGHSCIRISASLYGEVALVNVKENNRLNGAEFMENLRQVQQLAEKIGGSITINNNDAHDTSIVFSFLNLPLAA